MDYWEEMKKQPNVRHWLGFWDSSMQCACDHGCNQWLVENQAKASLIIAVLNNKQATTKPDKIAQMHVERAYKIWHRILRWQSKKANRELREKEKVKP